MELNRDQIVKALECCMSADTVDACKSGCPLFEGDYYKCVSEPTALHKYALALIKSQEQRIEELEAKNRQYDYEKRKLVDARDVYKEYAVKMQFLVENIKYKEEDGYEPSAARYAAEMDMWRVVALEKKKIAEENERLMREKTALECVVSTARNQAKADTVRKFAERLKALIKSDYINGTREQAMSAIDQIAKELLTEGV